jgi:hypothetical protein
MTLDLAKCGIVEEPEIFYQITKFFACHIRRRLFKTWSECTFRWFFLLLAEWFTGCVLFSFEKQQVLYACQLSKRIVQIW